MPSGDYECKPTVVRALFLRRKVVQVTIDNGLTTYRDIVKSVITSEQVADLHEEMAIYQPRLYFTSIMDPPLTLRDLAEHTVEDLLKDPEREIAGLLACIPLVGSVLWPLDYKPDEIPFLIDAPETIASLLSKVRTESRSNINYEEFCYSNEIESFRLETSCRLRGTRWDSRPLLQAILPDTTPTVRLVIKYTSSPSEPDIWNRILSLPDSRSHHLPSLFHDPIPVVGTNSGSILVMHDYANNLLDYSPPTESDESNFAPEIWAQHLCSAVTFLHDHRIVHRDIKPDNITIHPQTHELTLVDFSTAVYVAEGESFEMAVGPAEWVHPTIQTSAATIQTCLEEGRGESYDPRKMDMWAVGKVLMEFLGTRRYVDGRSSDLLSKFGAWVMESRTSDERSCLMRFRRWGWRRKPMVLSDLDKLYSFGTW